jgi:hypothetical protein
MGKFAALSESKEVLAEVEAVDFSSAKAVAAAALAKKPELLKKWEHNGKLIEDKVDTSTTKPARKLARKPTTDTKDKKPESKPEPKDKKEETLPHQWKPRSSAQIVFEVMKKAGKDGITIADGIKKAQGKFETTNLKGRVSVVFKGAVGRGIAKKSGDKFIALVK